MTIKPWTCDRVAARIVTLVAEHGCPNSLQLHEVVGDVDRAAVLAISRIARMEGLVLNRRLQDDRLMVAYQGRQSPARPACIRVSALAG